MTAFSPTPNAAPRLETKRLCLRSPEVSDIDPIWRVLSDAKVQRFVNCPAHITRKDVKAWISSLRSMTATGQGFGWMIEMSGHGKVMGSARVNEINGSEAEVGFELHPDFWNQGYMTEALRAVLAFTDLHLTLSAIKARIHPANGASKRVLSKCGFLPFIGVQVTGLICGEPQMLDLFIRSASVLTALT